MVGGTIFHRRVIPREISRVLVLNLLWYDKPGGACAPPKTTTPLTEPSFLSRGTLSWIAGEFKTTRVGHPPNGTHAPGISGFDDLPVEAKVSMGGRNRSPQNPRRKPSIRGCPRTPRPDYDRY